VWPVPASHSLCPEGKRIEGVEARALLPLVFSLKGYLDSSIGWAGVDVGQAREYSFVVIAPCRCGHPLPDALFGVCYCIVVGEAGLFLRSWSRRPDPSAHLLASACICGMCSQYPLSAKHVTPPMFCTCVVIGGP
jgi:hypothetical protein